METPRKILAEESADLGMSSPGKISVVMPCYNAERTLPSALESLRRQTYMDWECIIIDDGSSDGSLRIAGEWSASDERFKVLTQEHRGPSVARNLGVRSSAGAFIQFLDADDVLPPERFTKCLARFAEEPDTDIVYTEYITYRTGQGFSRIVPARMPEGDPFVSMLLHHNRSFVATIHEFLFRRSVITAHPFDEKLPPYCEDVECWLRIAESGARFTYLAEILAVYRFAGSSLSSREIEVNAAKLFLLERYEHHPKIAPVKSEYFSAWNYFGERWVIAHFMERRFADGFRAMMRQSKRSSLRGNVKMFGWWCALLLMKKETIAELRAWIVRSTPLKWGGWKQFSTWDAPESLRELMEYR